MDKQAREAQKEAVKTLAIAVGVREAARQLGLSEDRVRQWSKRGKWLQQEAKPQPPTVTKNDVTVVTKPSVALRNSLEEDNKATRLGLSKGVRKAAEVIANYPGERVIKASEDVRRITSSAAQIHNWEAQEQGSGILPSLRVYSEQTIINVEGNTDATSK